MDFRDELVKSPLLSMKNLKDDELEHKYGQPLLCLKLYLDKSESNVLIFVTVAQTPLAALFTLYLVHESTSIIMPKKVIFGIFYLALVAFAMFKQTSLLKAQRERIFQYLVEEGDIKNRAIHPPSKKIEIDYSPPSKQSRYCGLSYIFTHGWQAFASCLVTWAHFLVFLVLIISLCNVDEEIVKDMCPKEHDSFYVLVFAGFISGILQLGFTSIQLTSRCDEAELKLLRNVDTETHRLVLCKKRSEIKRGERIDSMDMLVFIEKRPHECKCKCNASLSKLRNEYQQTNGVKEASIDVIESDQTLINGQNMQFEASTQINKAVEEELRGLQSKYNDLQACFDDLKMKYDSLRHFLTSDNDIEAPPVLE